MSFPPSDHCNGKTFFYPGERVQRGLWDVMRWKFSSRPARWPESVALPSLAPPPRPTADEVVSTWVGHSTFLLQTSHGNLITDPVFSERCSPVSWAGPKRVHPPGIPFDALPKIDAVLLSHDHYDHCDLPSLRRLADHHAPVIFAPLGHAALLAGSGIRNVVELDWWQTHRWRDHLNITLTPSRHWCRRSVGGTNRRLWGGFYLTTARRRLYFMGDSGFDGALFASIKATLGAPELSFIPIGAYEPRRFMESSHMNPAEAVKAHLQLDSRQSVAMHWGTFQLTDEAREAPLQALGEARCAAGVTPDHFRTMVPGQSFIV